MTPQASPMEQLLEMVVSRSGREAAAFVLSEFEAGKKPATLVSDVLAPVQVEVGERWQRNLISVADEHAATAIVDNALATLAASAPAPRVSDRGTLAVVCAHGDWHTLPARMAAELWRWDGWDVTFLGGSLPPADLTKWLTSTKPDALAVSCAVPLFLPGVLRVATAAADASVPCVVGGRGLGAVARRADALGARWASSPDGLADALTGAPPRLDPRDLADRCGEAEELELSARDVAKAALGELSSSFPAVRDYTPEQLAHTRQDYLLIVRFLSAAVLCDDAALFSGFLAWLQTVLTGRGLPPAVLQTSITALVDALPNRYKRAHAMCGDQAVARSLAVA